MSENTGFRVSVFSHLISTNNKSPSSVYVDTNRFRTVQALKEHLSTLCDVPHGEFDLHCHNNFLPPNEDIRVLKEEDSVLILPNDWEVKRKRKRSTEIVDHVIINCEAESQKIVSNSKLKRKRLVYSIDEHKDQETPEIVKSIVPNKIERKRKKSIDLVEEECSAKEKSIEKAAKVGIQVINAECKSQESHEDRSSTIEKITFFEHLTHSTESNSQKAKDSMKRCSLAKCNSYNNGENVAAIKIEDSPLKETPTFITNRRKRTSTPYYKPIGTLLKELNSKSSKINENNVDADGEANDSLTKKRKRFRKRKRPTKPEIPQIDESPQSFNHQHFNLPSTSQQRIHIKFSDEVIIIPNDDEDAPPSSGGAESIVSAADINGGEDNSTDSAIEVVEVASSGCGSAGEEVMRRWEGRVTEESIANSPSMKNITPKAGDLIAFKMLRLSESYTPEPSNYITAKTIYYDLMSKSISLQIIEGEEQLKLPNGKFSLELLEGIEEKGQLSEEMTINWDLLIDPRLLYP